jgi:hypothetical protein
MQGLRSFASYEVYFIVHCTFFKSITIILSFILCGTHGLGEPRLYALSVLYCTLFYHYFSMGRFYGPVLRLTRNHLSPGYNGTSGLRFRMVSDIFFHPSSLARNLTCLIKTDYVLYIPAPNKTPSLLGSPYLPDRLVPDPRNMQVVRGQRRDASQTVNDPVCVPAP